jgi:branched-chain amino acid aminotransferase
MRPSNSEQVYGADEVFVTGTFGGLTPVRAVDGRVIGDGSRGPICERLQRLYADLIQQDVARQTSAH